MLNIKCSIIVPIYNVEKYLPRCIDSLINQNYKDIEILLINDGSTDNCRTICESYAVKDNRITVVNKKNGGLSSARNYGLDIATGDYIFFVDSDDYVEPTFCSKAIKAFYENNADIIVLGFNTVSEKLKATKHCASHTITLSKYQALRGLVEDGYINCFAWNKAYKASLFKDIRFPEGFTFEDVGTIHKLIIQSKGITVIPDVVYNYMVNSNSLSSKWWHSEKKIEDYFIQRNIQKKAILQEYKQLENLCYCQTAIGALLGITYFPKGKNNQEYLAFLNQNRPIIKKAPFPYNLLYNTYYFSNKIGKKLVRLCYK